MRFALLGPVEMRHDGTPLPTGGARQRFVLATLLLNAGRPTRAEALIDALWDKPPPTAKAQVHNMISKLRRVLRVGGAVVVSSAAGYELRLDGHEFDLLEFRRHAERGRAAAVNGDHAPATLLFADALALWRGPALADVADEVAAGTRQELHDERLAVVEAKLDAEIALGRNEDVLRELPALIAEHPFRESLHEKRLLALAACGRRADALACYRQVRRMFVDELGVEPGESLRRLEKRILDGTVASRPVPRQLPAQIMPLTGREQLVERITIVLRTRPVVLLIGPGGVGKTALALTVGHRLADRFPDGQLYANLRSTPHPHEIAGQILRALGIDGATLPDDPDERISLYRSHLATKRVLVVLDDASSEEQVRPLVPGTANCRTVVTSRYRLSALLGVDRWTIPVLTASSALELIAAILGRERVATEPEAAAAVVDLCARLPLALSIAAARLAANPHARLEEFRQRLTEERRRLDELSIGDLDVRASIAVSYRALDDSCRRLLWRLGLVQAPDWPAWVAGDRQVLDRLVDAHLVAVLGRDAVGQERFRLHDLVADFAGERAVVEDSPARRSSTLVTMLSAWLALATEADEHLTHGLDLPQGNVTTSAPPDAALQARHSPTAWFEVEWRGLAAAVRQACQADMGDVASLLALRLSGFFWLRSYGDEWERVLRQAMEHESGPLRLGLLAALFEVNGQRQRYTELPGIASELLAVARRLGEPEWEIKALRHRGQAAIRLGRVIEAGHALDNATHAARRPGVSRLVLRDCLGTLGWIRTECGEPEQALPLFEEALALDDAEEASLRTGVLLYHSGLALTDLGRLDEAERSLTASLQIADAAHDDVGMAYLEQALADVDIRRTDFRRAAERLARAQPVHERLGNHDGLAEAIRSTGDLAAATGRRSDAVTALRQARDICRGIGDRIQLARTLARLERVAGDQQAAAECHAILTDLGLSPACLRVPPAVLIRRNSCRETP